MSPWEYTVILEKFFMCTVKLPILIDDKYREVEV